MWQVKIPFNREEEKESIILSSYINNSQGIQECEKELVIFFDKQEDVQNFRSTISDKEILIEKVSEKINWLSKWQKFHRIIKINPFVIIPSFKKNTKIEKGLRKIIINPSFAFGTGSHPTTKMCIKLLIDNIKKGDKVLDLGCGSGILAICCEKLGARDILAVDIDDIALKEAKKNILKNHCKKINLSKSIEDNNIKFDVVVCNILLNTILELKPEIERVLVKGGKLILSGILKEQLDEVLTSFSSNFKLLGKRTMKDKNYQWVSFLYEKI